MHGVAAAQVLTAPHHSMLLRALRAPKQVGALPEHNLEFIKTLEIPLVWDT